MSVGSKILWSEGLTLGPQHFQLQDIYHEARLQRMIASLQPHFWGVRSVQWNVDGLGHNQLSADAISVIFPDGEIYDAPNGDLLPEPVDLSRLPADMETFTFHLALPIVKPHGGNAHPDGRYVRCETEAIDLFSEALALEVPFLKKRGRLVSNLSPRDTSTSLPVVQVRRASHGLFEIIPSFIPPSIAIGASPALRRILEGLISALTTKIESLQRMHRKSSADVFEVATGDISSWWMLQLVNTSNAQLMHSARSPGQHPEALYQKLLAAAAGLMTFSDRYKTADLPGYRHDALGEVFAKLDALLRDLVDTVISAKYFLIPLIPDKSRKVFHYGVLDLAMVTQETQLCLAVNADMPALELVAAVPVRLKVGSPDDLERIVEAAMPGIPLTHMPQVPAAVPVRPNTYYFSLTTKGTRYENALRAGALGVYAPDGIPGLKMELIAIS
jgi:type VI secretion system protein ImpJ